MLAWGEMFVLPSHGEHFGRVIIEAMAMAKPVVATMAGGVPEIVLAHETGLLVPPADPVALADAMLVLLNHPSQAAKYGAAGRRRVETHFSLERHVASMAALYREVM
jgi:glycosyltransferase involved in cell wall biosynthesis